MTDTTTTTTTTSTTLPAPPHILTTQAHGRRLLSGIQPSGDLHLGNHFGAIAQFVEAQHHNEIFIFIANLHAMTTVRDGAALRRSTTDVALDYLALGLDPSKVTLYRQHDLPWVPLLAWVLNCLTPVGDLERSVTYKDKVAKGLQPNAGLLTYPVLMAADILAVNAEVVPVGQDQITHVELARRCASRFNEAYGVQLFVEPLAQVNSARTVPGLDGAKMSKSYGNTIPIFATPDEYRRLVMAIKTDSLPVDAVKDPATCNAYALLSLVADAAELADWAARYRAGGLRYSAVKSRLLELLLAHFGPAMERRRALQARPWEVEEALRAGAQRAAQVSRPLMERLLDLVGLDPSGLWGPAGSVRELARPDRGWGS